jgi:hypothetical protein
MEISLAPCPRMASQPVFRRTDPNNSCILSRLLTWRNADSLDIPRWVLWDRRVCCALDRPSSTHIAGCGVRLRFHEEGGTQEVVKSNVNCCNFLLSRSVRQRGSYFPGIFVGRRFRQEDIILSQVQFW